MILVINFRFQFLIQFFYFNYNFVVLNKESLRTLLVVYRRHLINLRSLSIRGHKIMSENIRRRVHWSPSNNSNILTLEFTMSDKIVALTFVEHSGYMRSYWELLLFFFFFFDILLYLQQLGAQNMFIKHRKMFCSLLSKLYV